MYKNPVQQSMPGWPRVERFLYCTHDTFPIVARRTALWCLPCLLRYDVRLCGTLSDPWGEGWHHDDHSAAALSCGRGCSAPGDPLSLPAVGGLCHAGAAETSAFSRGLPPDPAVPARLEVPAMAGGCGAR